MIKIETNDYHLGGPKITVDEKGLAALSFVVELLKGLSAGSPVKMVQLDGGDDSKLFVEIESPEETEVRETEAREFEEKLKREKAEREAKNGTP